MRVDHFGVGNNVVELLTGDFDKKVIADFQVGKFSKNGFIVFGVGKLRQH